MAAIRHLGIYYTYHAYLPTKRTWWSLAWCSVILKTCEFQCYAS